MAVGPAVGVRFPDGGTLRAALDLATRAPSAYNSQPWRWLVGDRGLQLRAAPGLRSAGGDPQRRDVLLSCGATLHHCTVALAAMGWRAKVHRLPDTGDSDLLAGVEVAAQPPGELDAVLSSAIPRRRTDRRRYDDVSVPWRDIAVLGARAARAGVMLRQVEEIPPAADPITAADPAGTFLAPGILFAPGILLALGTEGDDDLAVLRAGEVTSLMLLSATAMGLASCAVTEPLAIPATREALRTDVFGDSGHPQIMVRMGWPAPDADPLPATPRRALPEVAHGMF